VPSYCRGLVVDSTGTIYVAATGSRSVLKITPQGKITTILQATSPWTPTGVSIFHGELYILEWHDVTRENLEVRSAGYHGSGRSEWMESKQFLQLFQDKNWVVKKRIKKS
jgi:hypothetical protein